MNFISTFAELNKLYENADKDIEKKVTASEDAVELDDEKIEEGIVGDTIRGAVKGFLGEEKSEDVDDADEIEIIDDEPKQVVCECSKCGALVIVDEVVVDEESDLVNVEDVCKFCEEKEGYKIIGHIIPYEEEAHDVAADENAEDSSEDDQLEELLDFSVPVNVTANGNDVAVGGLTN